MNMNAVGIDVSKGKSMVAIPITFPDKITLSLINWKDMTKSGII